eukprot:15028231-Alexandrium_andersonii.AAC.1
MEAELAAAREEVCSALRVAVEAAVGTVFLHTRPRAHAGPVPAPPPQPPTPAAAAPPSAGPPAFE